MSKGILFDATLCVGCLECERGCAEQNGLSYDDAIAAEKQTSIRKFTYVAEHDEYFMRRLCMHCVDPSCASVCPVGALVKTADGPVTYDVSKCMGCRYCMVACPFDVPKYEWASAAPKVGKCTFCPDRIASGRQSACSEACPTGATITGHRDELLAEARRRISENPSQYVNHVFGATEVGGTSVFLLSAVPFDKFGFKADYLDEPLPMTTYRVLSRIPDITELGFVLLGGIWWITHRREEVAAAEGKDKPAKHEE